MAMADRKNAHLRPINWLGMRKPPNNEALSVSIESFDLLAAIEADAGFDGMIPDPILETDLIDRLETEDSL